MFSLDGDPQYQAIASGLAALQKAALRFPEDRSKAFLAVLDEAFPDKGALPTGELLKEKYAGKSAKALELFGGKAPADLPPALLREHWSQTVYFSDKAWSRYLPAFLKAAVTDGRRDFLHSVLFMLGPRWPALYECPDAAHPEDAALGAAGAAAVAAFLELAMDAPGTLTWETSSALPYGMAERELHGAEFQYRWMACQALEWRFNRVGTPALEKARKEYAVLRSGGIPEPKLPSALAVAAKIREAFRDTPSPGHDLTDSVLGDEPFEYAVEFRGQDWKTLSVGFLSNHSSALSFFSAAAFRYFIPAYMLADLTGADWNADPVFALTHGLAKEDEERDDTYDWAALARKKFDPFSPEERRAVAAYLEHAGRQYASGDPRISEALASYWSLPFRA